jgi:hypothetical protein
VLGAALLAEPRPARAEPAPSPSSPAAPSAQPGGAAGGAPSALPVELDRVVVCWTSPDTGGPEKPQFIMARELAFEARIEALADGYRGTDGYADLHVRAALERHITETMLASLPLYTNPTPEQRSKVVKDTAAYAEAARLMLEQRVGGHGRLLDAARAEGIEGDEIDALLRRQARASLYLDRTVAPMLKPSEAELRALHQRGETPFTDRSFADPEVRAQVERWLVASRVASALVRYYHGAQARLVVRLIGT